MTAWLSDTLLYTGVLIALVLVLRRPAARWFGPKLAYALWALPALRLVLPPIELPASMAPQQAQLTDQALLALAMAADAQPIASAPQPAPLWERPELWLALWLSSAAVFLALRFLGYHQMRRELLAEARPVGEAGKVRLVETPAIASPVAFGVRDKVVALPPGFMALEDRGARDLAIAHELAHHRGHDILANFAAQPLLALHWFNPLAWMGWRAMRRDQEAACDARVLESCGREQRAAYADLIAGFAAGPRLALAAPMACPIVAEKSIIHRLRSLSMTDVSARRRMLGRLLLAGGALALPLTASISYASAQESGPQAVPVPPSDAPPAPPLAPQPPQPPQGADVPPPPAPPVPPEAPRMERHQQRFVIHRDGNPPAGAPDNLGPGEHHLFTMRIDGPLSREQQKHIEAMRKEMEKAGKDQRKIALAMSDMRAHMPDVSANCDQAGPEGSRSWTDKDGRQHVVICERRIREQAELALPRASMGLRHARDAIAGNDAISPSVKQEVLADLDREIARLDAERN